MTEDGGVKLVCKQELAEKLLSPPFLLRKDGALWGFGFAAREVDAAQKGTVTVIRFLDLTGSARAAIKGFEVLPGYQVAAGRLRGDSSDDLVAVDLEGRVRAFSLDGSVLPGFPTAASSARVLAAPPVVEDFNASGRSALAFVSMKMDLHASTAMACLLDSGGKAPAGYPLRLASAVVGSPVLARQKGRAGWRMVVCHSTGEVAAYDPAGARSVLGPARLASAPGAKASLAAGDLDGDGAEEIFIASGTDQIQRVAGDGSSAAPPLRCDLARFVAVAAGKGPDGQAVICAFDQARSQLFFWSRDSQKKWTPSAPQAGEGIGVHLAAVEGGGNTGSLFVLTLYRPGGEEGVDAVFDAHATPEMQTEQKRFAGELRKLHPDNPSELEGDLRDYKRSPLVTRYGQKKAVELLSGKNQTEVWVVNSAGQTVGAPPPLPDMHPFLDKKERTVAAPAVSYDAASGRLFLVLAASRKGTGGSRVCLYSLSPAAKF